MENSSPQLPKQDTPPGDQGIIVSVSQPQPEARKADNRLPKILIITIAVFLVITFFGSWAYYRLWKYQRGSVTPISADRGTYGNKEYGFEFKYPTDFYVETRMTKISDFPEAPELGLSLSAVLGEQDTISRSDIDNDCSLLVLSGQPQGIKSYCKIKQFNQVKGKLQKFYVGEDPSFGIEFVFYRNEARISLSIIRALPELHSLDSNMRVAKFNEYFDSIIARDSSNPDLAYYDTFEKILSTLKFIEVIEEGKITDWKTYRNENYGFSFAHPRNFRIVEDYYCGIASSYMEVPVVFEFALIQDIYTHLAQIPVICLEVAKTDKTIEQLLYLLEAVNKKAKLQVETPESPFYGWPSPKIESIETVTIGDLTVTKVVRYLGPGTPLTSLLQYYVTRPGYVFVFSANYDARCGSWVGVGNCGMTEKETLPRILSTFKFEEVSR